MDQCPICKSKTLSTERGLFDGIAFMCPTHGWIEVTDTALMTRANETREAWERALTNARARTIKTAQSETIAGSRPKIFDYDFGAIG